MMIRRPVLLTFAAAALAAFFMLWSATADAQLAPGGANPNTLPATTIDHSGTITLGGTAQQVMPANTLRRSCEINLQAPVDGAWFNDKGSAASNTWPSQFVAPGGQFLCSNTGAVSIWMPTTTDAFSAQEEQ